MLVTPRTSTRARTISKLRPCTCYHSRTASPWPSTSKVTLEDGSAAPASFHQLLPLGTEPATEPRGSARANSSSKASRHQRILQRLNRFESAPPPCSASPSTPSHPTAHPLASISPYLPLVTRERNHLLSSLRSNLYPPRSVPRSPDATWDALARLLRYPDVLPALPPTAHATSTRTNADEEPEAHDEGRKKIVLSLPELRRAFTVFASARPRTKVGLDRLLVVTELLAQRSKEPLSDEGRTSGEGGRDVPIRDLRGGGYGLREKDWRRLLLFAGLNLRAPRSTIEMESAVSLFTQYVQSAERDGGRGTQKGRRGSSDKADDNGTTIATYNSLLQIAQRARSWELFERIESRMQSFGLGHGDAATVGIKMYKEDTRGAHIESVWRIFEDGIERFGNEADETWNMMIWVLARRGMLEQASKMYEAMREGEKVDIGRLSPRFHADDSLFHLGHSSTDDLATTSASPSNDVGSRLVRPPPPSHLTYTRLIQAFSHRGDLAASLRTLRDMVSPPPSLPHLSAYPPSIHIYTCLFRGFATHGWSPNRDGEDHLWRNHRSRATRRGVDDDTGNKKAKIAGEPSFRALLSLRQRDGTLSTPSSLSKSSPWSVAALQALFSSFLSLTPPSPPSQSTASSTLPTPTLFEQQRTAPTSKQIFWLLLAYEVMSGGDSRVVLEVWRLVEGTFGEENQNGWKGWLVDKRIKRKIEDHREKVREEERLRALEEE